MRRRRRRKAWESRFRRPDRSGRLQYRLELGRSTRSVDYAAVSRIAGRMAAQPTRSLARSRCAQVSIARRRAAGASADDCGIEGGLPQRGALTNPTSSSRSSDGRRKRLRQLQRFNQRFRFPGQRSKGCACRPLRRRSAKSTGNWPRSEPLSSQAFSADRLRPIATRSPRPNRFSSHSPPIALAPRRRCARATTRPMPTRRGPRNSQPRKN